MHTDALIEALARDAGPVRRNAFELRLGARLLAGAFLALLLVASGLGLRPDLAAAVATIPFWGKAAYTLSLGVAGLLLTAQLARPESLRLRRAWLAAVPVGALMAVALAELLRTPRASREDLLVEPLWTCVPLILLLAVPLFVGLISALRSMAPTRLRAAGAAAGLAAGGFAATLYALYCQQISPTYILTRYTLAVALCAAVGALIGPRALRW